MKKINEQVLSNEVTNLEPIKLSKVGLEIFCDMDLDEKVITSVS